MHDRDPGPNAAPSAASAAALALTSGGLPVQAGMQTRCLPIHKVAALVQTLAEEAVPAAATLAGSDIGVVELSQHTSRISYAQMFRVLANACRLARSPATALRAGQRMHLSSYGMFGYGLMTSAGPAAAIEFAARYYAIVGSTAAISFSDRHGVWSWTLEPLLAVAPDSALYRFLVEMQFSTHLTLHRDLLGAEFAPLELRAAYPRPASTAAYERIFGCPVLFDQPANEFRAGNAWLGHGFGHANALTHALAAQHCADELAAMRALVGTAGAVRSLIAQAPERFGNMNAVAAMLGLNERTLRRRLKDEQTTFQDVLRQARLALALSLLSDNRLSNERIASRIGLSDATSFRHAFKRWTSSTPREHRGR